jgi:tRNA (guanine-N7-)-methyltransferase
MPPPPDSRRIRLDDWLHPLDPAAHWADASRPFEVDVGCGKGRFLLARAAAFPATNFLGIDRLLGRLNKIDRKARRRGLPNLRLLRMDAYYAVTYLLPRAAVDVAYIFFPDPWPKARHHDHRLFNPVFLDGLHAVLKPGGAVHAATDHGPYFEEIAAILRTDARFREIPPFVPAEEERTDFELLFHGVQAIHRCSFAKR